MTVLFHDNESPYLTFAQQASNPDAPAAGFALLFRKAGGWYVIDENDVVTQLIEGPLPAEIGVACSDESTVIDSTGTKATFRLPYAMTLTEVRASLTGAATTGTVTVDINEGGVSVLSTKLTIDATEKTSTTAATAAVISDSALADDAEITIDVDDDADGTATGLKVWLIGTRA